MLRVAANYHNASFAFDDFAFFAHGFNGRSYFHLKLPPCHEVLFKKNLYPLIPWIYLERHVMRPFCRSYGDISTVTLSPGRIRMKFHTKFSRDVSQNYVAVWQLNFKLSVWQSFQNLAFNFDYVFLGQVKNLLLRFLEGLYLTKPKLVKAFLSCLSVVSLRRSSV